MKVDTAILGILGALFISLPTHAEIIELMCGTELGVIVDSDRRIAHLQQPGQDTVYVEGRIYIPANGNNIPLKQGVELSAQQIGFGDFVRPGAPFSDAANGACSSVLIDRISGLLTYKTGCFMGGAVQYQGQCVPGHAAFQKKF